jgi:hypothetical protein
VSSTKASDVYSAGKILTELLNLSSAFKHEMQFESKYLVRRVRVRASCAHSPAAAAPAPLLSLSSVTSSDESGDFVAAHM